MTDYRLSPLGSHGRTVRDWSPAPILCRVADLSARAAAEELGVSRRQVIRWRNGHSWLRSATADRVACALGHHPAELWDGWA